MKRLFNYLFVDLFIEFDLDMMGSKEHFSIAFCMVHTLRDHGDGVQYIKEMYQIFKSWTDIDIKVVRKRCLMKPILLLLTHIKKL